MCVDDVFICVLMQCIVASSLGFWIAYADCLYTDLFIFHFPQLGRCLYFAQVLEAWQVCFMLKGRAGTGKSTLVQLVTRIYEASDTVIISNDSQSGFGLQPLTPDIFLWAVPELKTDFNVDQVGLLTNALALLLVTVSMTHSGFCNSTVFRPSFKAWSVRSA